MNPSDRETGSSPHVRGMAAMLGMVVLAGMGERIGERFLPLYLLALGGGVAAIGVLGALQNLIGALYSWPGGWLSDRIGHRRALMLFTAVSLVGYALVIAVPRWWAVLTGSLFFLAWSAVTLPAVMSLVADVMPGNRRVLGVSLHSLIRRIPMAVGPLLGGLLIARYGTVTGMRLAFGAAFALGALAIALVARFVREPSASPVPPPTLRAMGRLFPPALRRLLVSDILIRFTEQIPQAFVVVWAVRLHGITEVQFGLLTAIEMATAVVCYLPVAHFADRFGKRPFVLMTFGFFTLFPLVLMHSRSFGALAGAFVVRGLKEFGEPTRKALILDLAPEGAKAGVFGLYYLIRDVVVSAAALGGAWLWSVSPEVNLWTAFAFGVAGTVWFAVSGRDGGPAVRGPLH